MKPCLKPLNCACLLVAANLASAWAEGLPTRPVADEFQTALGRLAELTVTPPEALDFAPQQARFVRVVIHQTSGGQPGIDELEIFGPDRKENLALAKRGAVASASSLLPGHAIHQIEHLNDGLYGNDHSWIVATSGQE